MKQQINLLARLPQAKINTGQHTIKKMLWASAIISVVYTFYAFYLNVHEHILHVKLEQLTEDKKNAQKAYDETSAKYPAEAKATIAMEDKDIEQHIAAKRALLNLLQNNNLGLEGFSKPLEALSHTIEPGAWLTTIEFNISDGYVGVAGLSVSTEAVLKFVDNLGKSPAFRGSQFSTFKMNNPPDDASSLFSFVLSDSVSRQPSPPVIPSTETNAQQNTIESTPDTTSLPAPAPNINTNTVPKDSSTEKPKEGPTSVFMPETNYDDEDDKKSDSTTNNNYSPIPHNKDDYEY